MVRLGSVCLRRLSEGRRRVEVCFHRLLHNPKVTADLIIAGWAEPTVAASAGRHVLAIQDTSELTFRTAATRRRGLGRIGKGGGHGILLHPMLAVDAGTGDCLGLLGGRVWTRPPAPPVARSADGRKKKTHSKAAFADRESHRWVETAQEAKAHLGAAAMVTLIADREADMYALWASLPAPNVHVLGRVYHDRPVVGGGCLSNVARLWPVCGTRRITIREREDRPEREAMVDLRFGAVTLARPRTIRACEGLPGHVALTLLEVSEPAPPDAGEPVVWRLLTTHPVADADQAWQIVDWYRCRWLIEQFFRILKKQGLRIEDSQIDTADHLIKLVAIACRAAVLTLQLTQARDGDSRLPVSAVFDTTEQAVLERVNQTYASRTKRYDNPYPPRSLPWAAWIIARLGGWDGYPSSRPPGPITFKNGIDVLKTMTAGWALRDVCMP
ncbi:MAG TPA: IS4 family transposase [Azospirillum sp.]|nr:IS4 family transposase [Azospirillum sp.]